jgi:hypothetical protein
MPRPLSPRLRRRVNIGRLETTNIVEFSDPKDKEVRPMSLKRRLGPLLVLALAVLVAAPAGFGQTRRHDLSLSYGVLSSDQVVDIFTDIVTIVLTMGTFSKENQEFTGVPFLTYHYSANSRFGFGVAVGGYSSSGDLQLLGDMVGSFHEKNYVAAVELDYHWIMKPSLQVYSGAGFGFRYKHGTYAAEETSDTVNRVLPAFHINVLGVRFGRKIGFFLEGGVGYKGLLLGGVNAQF